MKNLRISYIILLIVSAALLGSAIGYLHSINLLRPHPLKSPNILIISFCSLKKNFLTFYNKGEDLLTPNIKRSFNSSFVFRNAYTKYPWTNLANYAEVDIPQTYLTEKNYRLLEEHGTPFYMRVPPGWEMPSKIGIKSHQLALYYQRDLELLRKRISTPSPYPFFLIAHFKYMHYPYIDSLNPNPNWDLFLNDKERSRILQLIDHSEQFPKKVPFQMVLSANPEILMRHPQIKMPKPTNELFNGFGFIADPKYLNPWLEEADYNQDFDLLRKIYKAKLHFMDDKLKDLFELFNDEHLQDNTVFIFTGDHGEAFMEHNLLTHAINIYDEMITYPLMVRFPKSKLKSPVFLDEQFYMGSINDLIKGIMNNEVTEDTFVSSAKMLKDKNEYIMLRNCSNTIQGVRWNNHWKLILNNDTGEKLLFDVEKDPGELHNLYDDHPEISAQLEIYIMDHIAELKKNLETRSLCEN